MSIQALAEALEKRRTLREDPNTSVYRIFHGHGEGDPRYDVECFGSVLVIYAYQDLGEETKAIASFLKEAMKPKAILIKDRWRKDRSDAATRGWFAYGEAIDPQIPVVEHGVHYVVEPYRAFNSGLFLDARPIREKLRQTSENKSVLNLFSYTGSLGVAALAGGAKRVLHVDSQGSLVERIEHNHRSNQLEFDARMVVPSDVYRFLQRGKGAGRTWSTIILDPPPNVAPKSKKFRGRSRGQDFDTLIPLCLPILEDEGELIVFLNRRDISSEEHEATLSKAWGETPMEKTWSVVSGDDFPEDDPEKKLRVSAYRLGTRNP
jgi:23S rRNA (cytosine1962-C5)-methyltransferase